LLIANERRKTPPCAETDPARRVARQMAPCRVAGLGKGNSLACVQRLAWNHLPRNADATETGTDPNEQDNVCGISWPVSSTQPVVSQAKNEGASQGWMSPLHVLRPFSGKIPCPKPSKKILSRLRCVWPQYRMNVRVL